MSIFSPAPITWVADTVCDLNTFNDEIKDKMTDIDAAFAAINAALVARIPAGVILMWSGSIASIPTGWFLCNGANGTPDLRDRFIVGAGSTYAVAATGGEAAHTLITAEMPIHNHTYTKGDIALHDPADLNGTAGYGFKLDQSTVNTGNAGSGNAHENRPPYYALAYIQKS